MSMDKNIIVSMFLELICYEIYWVPVSRRYIDETKRFLQNAGTILSNLNSGVEGSMAMV